MTMSFQAHAERSGNAVAGSGEWRVVETSGECSAFLDRASLGETFQFAGTRTSRDPSRCSAPPATLLEKFLSHPALTFLVPDPIANLRAQGHNRQVRLSWTPISEAVGYEIYRAQEQEPFALVAKRRATPKGKFVDAPLLNGVTYRYVLRWIGADGRISPFSDEASAAPFPPRP
jgi:hypothetical protein